jgi:hypothetical protein
VDPHLLIEGAAAVILLIAGGFFVLAAWRARSSGAELAMVHLRARDVVSLAAVPLVGLALLLVLIALANAAAPHHGDGHGPHGRPPGHSERIAG